MTQPWAPVEATINSVTFNRVTHWGDVDAMDRFYATWHWPERQLTDRAMVLLRRRMARAQLSGDMPQDHWLGWCIAMSKADVRTFVSTWREPAHHFVAYSVPPPFP